MFLFSLYTSLLLFVNIACFRRWTICRLHHLLLGGLEGVAGEARFLCQTSHYDHVLVERTCLDRMGAKFVLGTNSTCTGSPEPRPPHVFHAGRCLDPVSCKAVVRIKPSFCPHEKRKDLATQSSNFDSNLVPFMRLTLIFLEMQGQVSPANSGAARGRTSRPSRNQAGRCDSPPRADLARLRPQHESR